MGIAMSTPTITGLEEAQIERANASGATPVVFVHGLWLLPSSWHGWVTLFEDAGYAGLTPVWPDDPDTVEEARANPDVLARKTLKQVADHTAGATSPRPRSTSSGGSPSPGTGFSVSSGLAWWLFETRGSG